jgi:hypothetical protein
LEAASPAIVESNLLVRDLFFGQLRKADFPDPFAIMEQHRFALCEDLDLRSVNP